MFTHQFFDLLLNLEDNWQVKEVEADCNFRHPDLLIATQAVA